MSKRSVKETGGLDAASRGKSPAAVALGEQGGVTGVLTEATDLARTALRARWSRKGRP